MGDILYGESSQLMAALTINELKQFNPLWASTQEDFFKELYEKSPSLILLGDSLCPDIASLIFFLSSLPELREVPLVFMGDHEQAPLFPVKMSLGREDISRQETKIALAKILHQSRTHKTNRFLKTSENPDWPSSQNQMKAGSKASLLINIHEAYCARELGAVDVSSQKHFYQTLLQQTMSVLHSDFAYIRFETPLGPEEHFYAKPMDQGEEKKLFTQCRNLALNKEENKDFEKTLSYYDGLKIPEVRQRGVVISGKEGRKGAKITSQSRLKLTAHIVRMIALYNRFQKKKGETETIYSAFTKFLPPEIIDDLIIKDSDEDLMTGENRTIVVLFCHIRNFEQIMKENSPDNVVNFLNSHFSNMVEIIQWQGGAIDKFIGDAIYAIFGAPVSYPDNAARAARAAKMMIEEYPNTDTSYLKLPEGGFSIGVGLNRGKAIIGNIGCSEKFDYTAIGDTVNLAARLESLTKHYRVPILISEEVRNQLDREHYSRLVDIARVKGKSESTRIYSLEIEGERFSEDWRDSYEKGIRMYIIGNWRIALKYLNHALKLIADDFPTKQFIERCETFREKAPEGSWDGAVTLDFK
ncbi:MAG: adenylate/guanylate cyclase domain-containing protein [Spirochaetales bacterium]|nr:adenylate/guanylate cyclase domain-containing protein [Spirochaetales bacterium]